MKTLVLPLTFIGCWLFYLLWEVINSRDNRKNFAIELVINILLISVIPIPFIFQNIFNPYKYDVLYTAIIWIFIFYLPFRIAWVLFGCYKRRNWLLYTVVLVTTFICLFASSGFLARRRLFKNFDSVSEIHAALGDRYLIPSYLPEWINNDSETVKNYSEAAYLMPGIFNLPPSSNTKNLKGYIINYTVEEDVYGINADYISLQVKADINISNEIKKAELFIDENNKEYYISKVRSVSDSSATIVFYDDNSIRYYISIYCRNYEGLPLEKNSLEIILEEIYKIYYSMF